MHCALIINMLEEKLKEEIWNRVDCQCFLCACMYLSRCKLLSNSYVCVCVWHVLLMNLLHKIMIYVFEWCELFPVVCYSCGAAWRRWRCRRFCWPRYSFMLYFCQPKHHSMLCFCWLWKSRKLSFRCPRYSSMIYLSWPGYRPLWYTLADLGTGHCDPR